MRTKTQKAAASGSRIVRGLPTDPYLGQRVLFLADDTNEIVWDFVYEPLAGSAYPWKWVGGGDLYSYVGGPISTTNSTYNNAGGPSAVVPLAGDYVGQHGARGTSSDGNVGRQHLQNASIAVLANDGAEIIWSGGNTNMTHSSRARVLAMSAGHTIRVVHAKDSADASTITCAQVWLAVRPVRVKALAGTFTAGPALHSIAHVLRSEVAQWRARSSSSSTAVPAPR